MRAAWGEVVVTYGDTPVLVRHVRRESRRLRPRTMIGLGGALLLAGAAGFLADVQQDWSAHAQAVETAQERGDVRPPAPGPGLGAIGVTLALLGLVPLVLGAVRRADASDDTFTIGEAHDASLQVAVPGLTDGRFALLRAEAGPVLRFTAASRGELVTATRRTTLAATIAAGRTERTGAVHRVALAPGDRARLEHGALTFWISAVEPERAKVARGKLDGPTWFYSASALVVLGGLLALGHMVPHTAHLEIHDYDSDRLHHIGYLFKNRVPPPGDSVDLQDGGAGGAGPTGEAVTGGTGRTAPGRTGVRASAGGVPRLARDHDPERAARSAGVLALLASDGAFAAGTGSYAAGDGDGDVWAGLTGTQVGERNDVGGLGLAGTGRGGALHGEGAIGLGGVGLIGKGACGCGEGSGYGRLASAGFGGRGSRVPTVRLVQSDVQGALDRDIIRRVVRAHLQEIRHCYNQTLVRDPQAHGRVVIQFVIGGTGKVSRAVVGESDVKDPNLGACATQAVRRWSFSRPEGGGSVMVSYPFVFAPA